ncbi:universal stress protein family protein [Klebsormidium nitens]|uniref:Universal stress protein family protein n=1 Tax=Klebsormidium nitens TaxID=105231 RepID=A0A1Y1I5E7_KLENI|nr:universal stress protein family protein [Klebsormidium nitens]|eukprot:GAQ86184.1 universal stress protein family protein [Klebsormidium nitens]
MAESSAQRHIVIALDSSDHAKYALDWAIENVIRSGDNVVLLSVAQKDEYEGQAALWGSKGSPYIPLVEFDILKKYHLLDHAAIEKLQKVSKQNNIEVVGQIHYGDPRDKVVEACQQVAADLLVLGSRGLGSVKRVLLGSVSTYVVANAPCPVTVVKKP